MREDDQSWEQQQTQKRCWRMHDCTATAISTRWMLVWTGCDERCANVLCARNSLRFSHPGCDCNDNFIFYCTLDNELSYFDEQMVKIILPSVAVVIQLIRRQQINRKVHIPTLWTRSSISRKEDGNILQWSKYRNNWVIAGIISGSVGGGALIPFAFLWCVGKTCTALSCGTERCDRFTIQDKRSRNSRSLINVVQKWIVER